MNTPLTALFFVGLLASSASGQIRFFLDPQGVGEQEDRGEVDPLSYTNPQVAGSGRLYIYAEYLAEDNLWLAAGLDITIVGDGVFTDAVLYNHRTLRGNRWSSRNVTIVDPQTVVFESAWIGNPGKGLGGLWNLYPDADINDPKHFRRDWDSGPDADGTTIVGYVEVEGTNADVFFEVGRLTLVRIGGGPDDPVYFGYGDGPGRAGDVGWRSKLPDATIVGCDPCDMNCDGLVDALDIEPFIDLLFNGGVPCDPCTGDVNGDGFIDARDIEGFINCLFP